MKDKIYKKILFSTLCFASVNMFIVQHTYATPARTIIKTYENIQSEISLRPWDTKGVVKATGNETLTVNKWISGKGEIVILRQMENSNEFKAEIYRSNATQNMVERTVEGTVERTAKNAPDT